MKESISHKVAAITRKAKEKGKAVNAKTPGRSSLQQVIKTKAQADLFMKLLKEA